MYHGAMTVPDPSPKGVHARDWTAPARCRKHHALLLLAILLLVPVRCLFGATENGRRVLVKNVRVAATDEESQDVTVNLLVVGGVLEIVTQDELPTDEADTVVDCRGNILLGVLKIAEPANFVVLDGDPRKDMGVLLDTKGHTLLAVRDGKLVKNTLPVASPFEPQKEEKKPGWIGYTPPPLALPIAYRPTQHWNQWEGRAISGLFIGAVALDRQNWVAQDPDSHEMFGNLKDYDAGEIRAIRFGSIGTLNFKRPWVYTLFLTSRAFDRGFDATDTSALKVYDLRLDIPLPKRLTLSVGKQKEPISKERLEGGFYLPFLERPAVLDAMLPARDIGVTVSRTELDDRLTWAAGVYNDWLSRSGSMGETSNVVAGRVTWIPWSRGKDTELALLGLGLRYDDAKEPIHYAAEPEFKQGPLFVDTGPIDARNAFTLDLEASWRRGPVSVSGEFLRSRVDAPLAGDPVFSGYNVRASWIVTGEMRPYNARSATFGPVPVSRSVYQGGWGAWELAARYSSIDLTDGTIDGGEMGIVSLGAAWYLTSAFHLRLDYRHIELDREDRHSTSDGFLLRLVLLLE